MPEVVLEIENSYGFLILRYTEGKVHGNIVGYRSFAELKKNGMFHASGGCDNFSWAKVFFIKDNFVMDENITIYGQSYYKKEIPITEETWKQLNAEANEMENIEWYDFSPESIETLILKNPLFSEISAETQQLMDQRQAYIDSLSYLIDMTYDYTKKSPHELNADAKKYYDGCQEELEKIYDLCIEKLPKEEAEKLKEEQREWEEIITKRLTDDMENSEDQTIYYSYGDILLKRVFHLINVCFDVHFFE